MKTLLFLIFITMAAWADVQSAPPQHRATVTETMESGGYTYMKVKEGEQTYWVAVTATPVTVGQTVTFIEQMWMPHFKSRTLGRTFDKILFASMAYAPGMHPSAGQVKPKNAPDTVLKKAEGGYSVAEVFEKRASLKGKTVRVRGKVTKISKGIMKRNWVHLEDGTGNAVTNDLVFTSASPLSIAVGDIVIAKGTVTVDKDFGYGYFYPVIIEQSTFSKEPR